MRGAQLSTCCAVTVDRIIPADAGSTSFIRVSTSETQDHPRGCGEHFINNELLFVAKGSSPRMRGAQRSLESYHRQTGIIPADAGSTRDRLGLQQSGKDHPRGCGEHMFALLGISAS